MRHYKFCVDDVRDDDDGGNALEEAAADVVRD